MQFSCTCSQYYNHQQVDVLYCKKKRKTLMATQVAPGSYFEMNIFYIICKLISCVKYTSHVIKSRSYLKLYVFSYRKHLSHIYYMQISKKQQNEPIENTPSLGQNNYHISFIYIHDIYDIYVILGIEWFGVILVCPLLITPIIKLLF